MPTKSRSMSEEARPSSSQYLTKWYMHMSVHLLLRKLNGKRSQQPGACLGTEKKHRPQIAAQAWNTTSSDGNIAFISTTHAIRSTEAKGRAALRPFRTLFSFCQYDLRILGYGRKVPVTRQSSACRIPSTLPTSYIFSVPISLPHPSILYISKTLIRSKSVPVCINR